MSRISSRAALAALMGLSVLLIPIVGPTPFAAAEATPDVTLVEPEPPEVLSGDTSPDVTLVESEPAEVLSEDQSPADVTESNDATGNDVPPDDELPAVDDVLPAGLPDAPSSATPSAAVAAAAPVGTGLIGYFVWDDRDGDGVQDSGEPGIPGVTVSIIWAGPDDMLGGADDELVGNRPTGPGGFYLFANLPPGIFEVSVSNIPAGFVETHDLDGTASPSRAEVPLAPGQIRLDVNFGFQKQADLELVQTVVDDELLPGELAIFRLFVSNNGPAQALGPIVVVDTVPVGLTPLGTLAGGWTCDIVGQVVTCTRPGPLAAGGSVPQIALVAVVDGDSPPVVTNTATVSSATVDVNPANNTAAADVTTLPPADLAIDKSHVGDFTVGVDGSFSLAVTNLGSTPDPGPLTVVDELPPGLEFVSGEGDGWSCVAAGQTVTCGRTAGILVDESTSFDIVVTVGTAAEGVVTNIATVSSPAFDPVSINDADTDDVTVIPSADVAISKTHTDDFVVGREVTWSIDVANGGPSVSTGPIVVSDTIPDGFDVLDASGTDWTCDVADQLVTCTRNADLAVGNAPRISLTVVPLPGFEGTTSNSATVQPTTGDPDETNNSSTDPADIIASVDLVLVKSLDDASLVIGSTGTYTLLVTNNGPSSAVNVVVKDMLPSGLTFDSSGGDGWTCIAAGSQVDCSLDGGLGTGESSELTIVVDVVSGAGSSVENIASVASAGFESVEADNTASSGSVPVSAALVSPSQTTLVPRSQETGELPRTGTDAFRVVLFGLVLVVLGRFVLHTAHRRQRRASVG